MHSKGVVPSVTDELRFFKLPLRLNLPSHILHSKVCFPLWTWHFNCEFCLNLFSQSVRSNDFFLLWTTMIYQFQQNLSWILYYPDYMQIICLSHDLVTLVWEFKKSFFTSFDLHKLHSRNLFVSCFTYVSTLFHFLANLVPQ